LFDAEFVIWLVLFFGEDAFLYFLLSLTVFGSKGAGAAGTTQLVDTAPHSASLDCLSLCSLLLLIEFLTLLV